MDVDFFYLQIKYSRRISFDYAPFVFRFKFFIQNVI